jgi:hypothetical protein
MFFCSKIITSASLFREPFGSKWSWLHTACYSSYCTPSSALKEACLIPSAQAAAAAVVQKEKARENQYYPLLSSPLASLSLVLASVLAPVLASVSCVAVQSSDTCLSRSLFCLSRSLFCLSRSLFCPSESMCGIAQKEKARENQYYPLLSSCFSFFGARFGARFGIVCCSAEQRYLSLSLSLLSERINVRHRPINVRQRSERESKRKPVLSSVQVWPIFVKWKSKPRDFAGKRCCKGMDCNCDRQAVNISILLATALLSIYLTIFCSV